MLLDQQGSEIDVLRDVLKRRSLKLSEVAEQLGLPYRTVQNYFAKRSDIPLSVYLGICRLAGVSPAYPASGGRSKLDHAALQQALIDVCGTRLPSIRTTEAGLDVSGAGGNVRSAQDLQRDAGTLAVLLEGRYDLAIERSLDDPLR